MYLSMGMEIQDDEKDREEYKGSNNAEKLETLQPRRFSSSSPLCLRSTRTHFSLQSAPFASECWQICAVFARRVVMRNGLR